MELRPHRARRNTTALVLALVASACTSSSSDPTTTTTVIPDPPGTTSTAPATSPVEMPSFPDDDVAVDVDSGVTIGMLDNGLTYYIRRNTRPGTRAQLRLAVRAGSAVEDPDQTGVAHFVEHMLFNGTEAFPANELIKVLERFGSEFGPDINAFTSYDQTVYELQVPTNDPDSLETAFDVLAEWSSRATFDPAEIDLERGVMLEEWRLRSQSFGGRYFEAVSELLFEGSPYAGHDTLAGPSELDATTPETLTRFYEDWYRPDLMAVVAVGDFSVAEVEQLIRERFGPLQNPANPRLRPDFFTAPATEARFAVLPDPEYQGAFVELNYPLPALELGTIGAERQGLALGLAFDMIVTRLQEDAQLGGVPFFEASYAENPFVDEQRTPGLGAFSDPVDLAATAEAVLIEVQRALQFGFGADELERSIDIVRDEVELAFDSRASKQDVQYADEYLSHFLVGSSIPDSRARRDLLRRLLDQMTTAQVADTLRATLRTTQPLVIVAGPDSAAAQIPTADTLAEIVTRVALTEVGPRSDDALVVESLMTAPDPVDIVDRGTLGRLLPTVIELENGVRVVYLETDIAADTVTFGAMSPGGWLVLPAEDAVEGRLVGDIVVGSGVGDFNQVTLDRFLTGETVQLVPYIDEDTEGFFGSSDTAGLELLFQLIHLYMTEPRVDQQTFANLLGQLRPLAAAPDSVPLLALANEVNRLRYDDDPRYLDLPTVADLDNFDLDRALAVYRERFADADDFVFAFAGDFAPGRLEELSRRYLGTLPSLPTSEPFPSGRPLAPTGVLTRTVEAGEGELGAVAFVFTTERIVDNDTEIRLAVLESVLNQRLTELLREELSATYSPLVTTSAQFGGINEIEVYVQVSGDPEGLETIREAFLAALSSLRLDGPTEDELAIAIRQVTSNFEFVTNPFWVGAMLFYSQVPGADPEDLISRIADAEAVTARQVRDLSRLLLPAHRYIQVKLIPAG